MGDDGSAVSNHYSSGDLGSRILAGLEASGKDLNALTAADLSPVDEFHTRGAEATRELAEFAGIAAGSGVVDVGSGLGGPARHLASQYGCKVTGLDLTEEFCQVATMLSERTGMTDKVSFHHGSALDMPFSDGLFDVAWTIQAQMNIADKPRFYAEIYRVLRPGGRLVFQDIFQGPGGDALYPVPWADSPHISFLVAPELARAAAEGSGFETMQWRDVTDASLAWYKKQPDATGKPLPPLGLHLVTGQTSRDKRVNQLKNLQEGRAVLVQAMLQKPV